MSERRTGRADPDAAAWVGAQDAAGLWLSVIMVQEIEIRTSRANAPIPRRARVLPVTLEVARGGAALQVPDPHPAPASRG